MFAFSSKKMRSIVFLLFLSNGKELNAYTPKPDTKGITLNIVNKNSDKVALHIISNKKRFKNYMENVIEL